MNMPFQENVVDVLSLVPTVGNILYEMFIGLFYATAAATLFPLVQGLKQK